MQAPSSRELVVMTQNAWGGAPVWRRREQRLAGILGEHAPTALALQEIHADDASGNDSQAHLLAQRAPGYRAFFWPSHVGNAAKSGACEGVALLLREDVEVLSQAVERLSLDPDDALDRVTQRVIARTSIRFEGEVVDIFVTHLAISKRARARTVREVLAFTEEGRRASGSSLAVLMGDLNAPPAEAPIKELEATWTDAWRATWPEAKGGTWPSISPFIRIDYVFVQPGARWAIAGCKRAPFAGADHLGVMARLRLAEPGPVT